ncbi:YlbD family protein [Anaerobacillus sp. CMMVII]|uniref:YlbD family protein n=1 Tax=Anaerobacillus sp. CMMVII TaxID=2755588 RepID=UPI0021B714A0|nr:YlbD family protein [Anaerobacillus sp. CMMVII]MCT8139053.1 YlbD family protein [Anaerobacillus sp. CMMVII]
MSKKTALHPSVQQFKQFVKKHPLLIKDVREGKKTWQEFYEEWTLFGEKDSIWEKYRKVSAEHGDEEDLEEEGEKATNESQGSQVGDLLSMLKSINLNDIQNHVQNLSGMMATVQGLLQTFQSNPSNQSGQGQQQQGQSNQQTPFNFRQF